MLIRMLRHQNRRRIEGGLGRYVGHRPPADTYVLKAHLPLRRFLPRLTAEGFSPGPDSPPTALYSCHRRHRRHRRRHRHRHRRFAGSSVLRIRTTVSQLRIRITYVSRTWSSSSLTVQAPSHTRCTIVTIITTPSIIVITIIVKIPTIIIVNIIIRVTHRLPAK